MGAGTGWRRGGRGGSTRIRFSGTARVGGNTAGLDEQRVARAGSHPTPCPLSGGGRVRARRRTRQASRAPGWRRRAVACETPGSSVVKVPLVPGTARGAKNRKPPRPLRPLRLNSSTGAGAFPMLATKERSSYLGERGIGHQDPGATSTYLLLRVMADVAREKKDKI